MYTMYIKQISCLLPIKMQCGGGGGEEWWLRSSKLEDGSSNHIQTESISQNIFQYWDIYLSL